MSLAETPPHSRGRLRAALGKTALKAALGTAVAMGVLGAGQAQALVVNVNGQNWNVTTFNGSVANLPKFASPPAPGMMPWWSNESLAIQFATAVGAGLGLPNIGGLYGPFFGWADSGTGGGTGKRTAVYDSDYASIDTNINASSTQASSVWAQAELVPPVPGPIPALGATAAFGFSRKLRKRIKVSKAVGASFTAA